VLEPDPETHELILTRLHPGVTAEQAVAATGWKLRVAEPLTSTEPPSEHELTALRALTGAKENP